MIRGPALLGAALLLALSGCSLLPRSGGGPATAPVPPAGEGVASAPDSVAGARPVEAPADSTEAPVTAGEAMTPPAADSTATAPTSDPVSVGANDQVQFELGDGERDALMAQATKTLSEIRKRLDKLDRSRLSADRQERLHTIESLVRNAEDSMGDDVRASVTLSRKARLLLDDLVAE